MTKRRFNQSIYMSLLFIMMSAGSYGQTLKTFNGSFPNGKSQPGTASYKYYEDPQTREYIKQGPFKYSIIGKDDLKGLKQTISGNYEKGLKQGTWTYKLIMNDYFLGYYHATGTITLISNYKNGLADGNWTYYTKNKTRKYSNYTGWGEYRPEEVVKASMNFVNGKVVGNVDINEVGVFTAKGSYDEDSYSVGTWKLNLLDKNQTYEITYKNKFMTDFIGRNGSGQILDGSTSLNPELNAERNQKYLDLRGKSTEELEIDGYELDTVCSGNIPTKYIQPYFKYMMSPDWFLYKFIKGDLTYDYNSIHGGCNIVVNKIDFREINCERADKLFNSGSYFKAFNSYIKEKDYIKRYPGYRYRKSDLKRLDEKLKISFDKADSLSKILISKDEVRSLEKSISARSEEEINQIKSSSGSQNLDFYRPYQEGAKNNLKYLNFAAVKKAMGLYVSASSYETRDFKTVSFDPSLFLGSKSNVSAQYYYVDHRKDSLLKRTQYWLDKCLNENKKLLSITKEVESKTKKIEELNLKIKTKQLYATYSVVMNDLKISYMDQRYFSSGRPIHDYINLMSKINLSLDKIIALYNGDSKTMDKALKKANPIKNKNQLLFPLFSFGSDGGLENLYDL